MAPLPRASATSAPGADGPAIPGTSTLLAGLADRYDDTANYRSDPVGWALNRAGITLTRAQCTIAESVRDNRMTLVHSAHDLGKSLTAAAITAWWIDSHRPGEAFVVTTAPTAAQVSAILWREIGRIHRKAELIGKINRAGYPQWYLGDELVGYGRKPADYEDSAFQGIHAPYVLIVVDEAGGVSKSLFDQVDTLATNDDARVLAIGNPDDSASHFAKLCGATPSSQPAAHAKVIGLDGLRSPNFTKAEVIGPDPTSPRWPLVAALMAATSTPFATEPTSPALRRALLSPMWVEERIESWAGVSASLAANLPADELQALLLRRTEASPMFTAKVRGQFPADETTGVIPLGWATAAVNRGRDLPRHPNDDTQLAIALDPAAKHTIGVDVARTGADATAFAHRYTTPATDAVTSVTRHRITDTMATADRAAAHGHSRRAALVIDVIGIGAGVYDRLRRYRAEGNLQARVIPFNASARTNPKRKDASGQFGFRNDRAAGWWRLREMLDPSRPGTKLALPDDDELVQELTSVGYSYPGGLITIESKDDLRTRLGRSPDAADAVVMATWADPDSAAIDPGAYAFAYDLPTPSRGPDPSYRYAEHEPFTEGDLASLAERCGYTDPRKDWHSAGGLREWAGRT